MKYLTTILTGLSMRAREPSEVSAQKPGRLPTKQLRFVTKPMTAGSVAGQKSPAVRAYYKLSNRNRVLLDLGWSEKL